MNTRRQFVRSAAGVVFAGSSLCSRSAFGQGVSKRREVMVGGKRVRTIDLHAHVVVPEATALMGTKTAPNNPALILPKRFETMDEWGTDMQALSINANWYALDHDLVDQVIRIQNEKLAEICTKYPDRFVAFAS